MRGREGEGTKGRRDVLGFEEVCLDARVQGEGVTRVWIGEETGGELVGEGEHGEGLVIY
jgi:hypothetical protein